MYCTPYEPYSAQLDPDGRGSADIAQPWEHDEDEQVLACPQCGLHEHHIEYVDVWMRAEDKPAVGYRISKTNQVEFLPPAGNPSLRREGIVLHMTCEACHNETSGNLHRSARADGLPQMNHLVIQQHKGPTFVAWMEPEPEVGGDE